MATFKLEIQCDNAAFRDDDLGDCGALARGIEISRILKQAAKHIDNNMGFSEEDGVVSLYDANGNKVVTMYIGPSRGVEPAQLRQARMREFLRG
jgi:hypothetical protein